MNRLFVTAVVAFVMSGITALGVQAQDSVLAELYGQGVHAYFANDATTAHEMLSGAIAQGSQDPRCYYFRGLAYLKLGRPDEASADFKKGAEFEAGNTDRLYPVSDSLQRVQGRARVQIEKYRQMARLATRVKANKIEQARYEQLQQAEKEVVRNPNAKPSTPPAAEVAVPPAPAGDKVQKTDPFAEGNQVTPEKAAEKPVAATPPAADPFGAAGTPAPPAAGIKVPGAEPTPPAEADPFGAPAATPATPTPPMPKDDAKTDPFSDDKPAADKPATDKPAEPPAGKPEKPAESSDPFGA